MLFPLISSKQKKLEKKRSYKFWRQGFFFQNSISFWWQNYNFVTRMYHYKIMTKLSFYLPWHFQDKITTFPFKCVITKLWQNYASSPPWHFCDKVITLSFKWVIKNSRQNCILYLLWHFHDKIITLLW